MEFVVLFILVLVIIKFLMHEMIKMLCSTDKAIGRAANYRGKVIPAIGGIVFVPILLMAVLLLLFLFPDQADEYIEYLLLILCMGFIGVVDDLLGDKKTKGLIRHFASTMEGTMTTGFLKAITGLLVASIVSLGASDSPTEYLLNIIILALFANIINLFDLRPGRSIKAYLFYSLMLLCTTGAELAEAAPFIVMGLAVIVYARYDLKEVCMLGDTGANILGITLGYYTTVLLTSGIKLMLAVILVIIHIVAERVSISDLIGKSRILNYIDSLGRGQKVK